MHNKIKKRHKDLIYYYYYYFILEGKNAKYLTGPSSPMCELKAFSCSYIAYTICFLMEKTRTLLMLSWA